MAARNSPVADIPVVYIFDGEIRPIEYTGCDHMLWFLGSHRPGCAQHQFSAEFSGKVFWHAAAVPAITAAAGAKWRTDAATVTRDSAAAERSDKNCQENNYSSHISN
jgi:hypothetical protein